MPKTRKTWRQKLEEGHSEHGEVVDVPPKMQNRFGTGTMLIPKPLDVDALIRKVPKGKTCHCDSSSGEISERCARPLCLPYDNRNFPSHCCRSSRRGLKKRKRRSNALLAGDQGRWQFE